MSHPVPGQPSPTGAAQSDAPPAPRADRPLPEFQPPTPSPYSPIEREIERSQRASAALAAARAVARASFTDSQLAADDAAGDRGDDSDIDGSGWIRTEYAALDHAVRQPPGDVPRDAAPRHLVGGSFNPGIASQQGRTFPSTSIAHSPIKTRSGAQARFLQESRQTPRVERPAGGAPAAAKSELSLSSGPVYYDKPAVLPMLAPAMPPLVSREPAQAAAASAARSREPLRFLMAAGIGAVVVLMAGGVAWKSGLLPHDPARGAVPITPEVAAQAEAARLLSAGPHEIPVTPAAGVPSTRSPEEIDAALAAAARAAAVPAASVRAAGPARVSLPPSPAVAMRPVAPTSTSTPRAPAGGKPSVADAIANAQARSDNFLSTGAGASPPASTGEGKPPQ